MPLLFETSNEKTLFIASAVYYDDASYQELGKLLGLTGGGVRDHYKRFVRKASSYRGRNRFDKPTVGNWQQRRDRLLCLDLLDERFIPIDPDLAHYNIRIKSDEVGYWSYKSGKTNHRGLNVDEWVSLRHLAIMMRKTTNEDGVEFWECNEHFFNQCLEHPDRQKGKNGIFTSIPK